MTGRLPGPEICFGCSLCLLACPLWRATGDMRLTPHGRARALQCGAKPEDLAASVDTCTFCGACEPACPAQIGLMAMIAGLRADLARREPWRVAQVEALMNELASSTPVLPAGGTVFLPDETLHADTALLVRIVDLLGGHREVTIAEDSGADIALALEAGATIPGARVERFLTPLRRARRLVVGDGLLFRALRVWLPSKPIETLGCAVSSERKIRRALRSTDLYVIEPRAYHADHERLVRHYDALRAEFGCSMNLDLQRLAIPTTAGCLAATRGQSRVDERDQARWILEGHEFSRIVVEDLKDIAAFASVTAKPVMHLVEIT